MSDQAQTWRVECEGGEVREVEVMPRDRHRWAAERSPREVIVSATARELVATIALLNRWPIVAILAPGESTREEDVEKTRVEAIEACIGECERQVRYFAVMEDLMDACGRRGGEGVDLASGCASQQSICSELAAGFRKWITPTVNAKGAT